MNSCDRLDHLLPYWSNLSRKTIKLRKRMFRWLLEMPQVKMYIIYLLCHRNEAVYISLKTFQESFIEQLLDCAMREKYSTHFQELLLHLTQFFLHFENSKHSIQYTNKDQNLVVFGSPQLQKKVYIKVA